MAMQADDKKLREQFHRVEALLQEVERFKDPNTREQTRQIVQALLDLHGAGLERILEKLAGSGEPGRAMIDAIAKDDLVSGLLLLYGLHPRDLNSRIAEALEKVRPYLHSHGGNVELLGVEEGIVRLRLEGSCHGCPSSALTLKQTIEEALYEKAPDIVAIQVEGELAAAPATVADSATTRRTLPVLAG